MQIIYKKRILIFLLALAFAPIFAKADTLGQQRAFSVEPGYSDSQKSLVNATLVRASNNAYFYVDTNWLSQKTDKEKESIYSTISLLGTEFDSNIYPQLTTIFGHEASPGIDKDYRVTVLLYSMKENARGYVRTVDEYDKLINPLSNQREMVYLNADNITNPLMKAFLAHEFVHLITFNQKELTYGISEDVWLNEARAEYAPTLLGYDTSGTATNYLDNRAKSFIDNPTDSLVEWKNSTADYGIANIFIHYLVDQYGLPVLVDSLKSKQVGIASLNTALLKSNFKDTFDDVFTNFTIASYLNDCSISTKYCFKGDSALASFHLIPFSNFLPFSGESNLNLGQTLKDYSAHWQKFSGGSGNLKIVFKNQNNSQVSIPYILKNYDGTSTIKFLKTDSTGVGELVVPNINQDVISVILIPSIEIKDSTNYSATYNYSIAVSSFVNSDTNANQGNTDTGNNNNQNNNTGSNIKLPFEIDKPLNQMNREELLMVLLRLIITMMLQGKTLPVV